MNNQKLFLDWFNNFLTIGAFMDYYGFELKKAEKVIRMGYLAHESQFTGMVFEVQTDYEMDKQ